MKRRMYKQQSSASVEREADGGLSEEDARLIEERQFGAVLDIYWLKPKAVRFYYVMSWAITAVGLLAWGLVIYDWFERWSKTGELPDIFLSSDYFPSMIGGAYALILGRIIYPLYVRRDASTHVIICEEGMLRTRMLLRWRKTEAVRWENIYEIKETLLGFGYEIHRSDGETLTLESYQDQEEMIDEIWEHSVGLMVSEEETT